jgi:peptidoglycan/xylan/chitin deacetylase (PgdA/CDA1 family)
MNILISRIIGKAQRLLAYNIYRRAVPLVGDKPVISFTFDDAPQTAFHVGGAILKQQGCNATFFVALGLLGHRTEVGDIASFDDLKIAAKVGHELGCHTYNHLNTWKTNTETFMQSVEKNNRELGKYMPGTDFKTFSYPISVPRFSMKHRLEKYFLCCRGGGQTINKGSADLNLLKAYFIDKRNNFDFEAVRKIIDYNTVQNGWLIFATHDVTDHPSPYGCTPQFFQKVVEYASQSGSLILTVRHACERILESKLKSAPSVP